MMKKITAILVILLAFGSTGAISAAWPELPPGWQPLFLPLVGRGSLSPELGGCPVFPANNIWNRRVDDLPVHPLSGQYVEQIGVEDNVHADFGSGTWEGFPIGIPYVIVPSTQAPATINFQYAGESDPGPYPIPENAPIEGNPNGGGDRHILILQQGTCKLYEIYAAQKLGVRSWKAGSGAVYDLRSNALRPANWTSADAAGLAMLPGLVRYDEAASGVIRHAIRFTAPSTPKDVYVWPARHYACGSCSANAAPFGTRFRLKASFDVNSLPSRDARIIARAMQVYGIILADNGAPWFIGGAPDERWDNDVLHELDVITGSDFEAVDTSGLMVDPDSGASR
jgi:hypothetical protein